MKVYIVGVFQPEESKEENPSVRVLKVFSTKEQAHKYVESFSIQRQLFGDDFIVIGTEVVDEY